MAEASTKGECAWRTANAGGRLVMITAVTCELTRSNPEGLARCYKYSCKGIKAPEAETPLPTPPVRAEVSKHEESEASELPLCPCGCGRPVKRGNTYAGQGCSLRWRAHRPLSPAAEAAPDHLNGPDEMVPVRPEVSKDEEPAEEAKGSPVVGPGLCACGCGQPARPRSKYADKGCPERLFYREHREQVLERTRQRRVRKKAEKPPDPRLESERPKALKAPETLKEAAQRHPSGGPTEMVEPTVPVRPEVPVRPSALVCRKCHQPANKLNVAGWCSACASAHMTERKRVREARSSDPLAALLEGYTEMLEQIRKLAKEELRTPQAQAVYLLREYLHIHAEAVRLAAQEAKA